MPREPRENSAAASARRRAAITARRDRPHGSASSAPNPPAPGVAPGLLPSSAMNRPLRRRHWRSLSSRPSPAWRSHSSRHAPADGARGADDGHLRRVAGLSTQGHAGRPTAWDYRKAMKAFAPVIGAKPSSGALFGVAGNIAFYRGDPATTRISSVVASLTFSSKGQIAADRSIHDVRRRRSLAARSRSSLSVDLARNAAARHERRHATTACWPTSTFSGSTTRRITSCAAGLYAGAGFYFDNHINIGPRKTMTMTRQRRCRVGRRHRS